MEHDQVDALASTPLGRAALSAFIVTKRGVDMVHKATEANWPARRKLAVALIDNPTIRGEVLREIIQHEDTWLEILALCATEQHQRRGDQRLHDSLANVRASIEGFLTVLEERK